MRRAFYLAGGLGAALALALLMAATGGFPSRPTFQKVTIRNAAPNVSLTETDAAADNGAWDYNVQAERLTGRALTDAGSAVDWLRVDRTGNTIDSVDLRATAVTVNGAAIGGGGFIVSETAYNGAALAVGETIVISKAADSAFTSATCTLDPHLQVTNLPAGHYSLDAYVTATGGADGTRVCTSDAGITALSTSVCGGGNGSISPITNTGGALCAGATFFRVHLRGESTKAWAGGTIGIAWRENTLGGVDGTVESDSWLRVTRLL